MKRIFSPFLISWVVTLLFISVTAQSQVVQFDSLKVKIDSIAKKYNVPGAQVLVFTRDSVLFKQNVGVKNRKVFIYVLI